MPKLRNTVFPRTILHPFHYAKKIQTQVAQDTNTFSPEGAATTTIKEAQTNAFSHAVGLCVSLAVKHKQPNLAAILSSVRPDFAAPTP